MSGMRDAFRRWFATYWPSTGNAQRVIDGYQAMGQNRELMADIALRGNLFTVDYNQALTSRDDAIAEGRRQFALEVFKLAKMDPADAYGLIERPHDRRS